MRNQLNLRNLKIQIAESNIVSAAIIVMSAKNQSPLGSVRKLAFMNTIRISLQLGRLALIAALSVAVLRLQPDELC